MPAGITFSHGLRSECAYLPELLHLLFHLPNSYLPNFLVYRIIKSGILKLLYLYIIHTFNIYYSNSTPGLLHPILLANTLPKFCSGFYSNPPAATEASWVWCPRHFGILSPGRAFLRRRMLSAGRRCFLRVYFIPWRGDRKTGRYPDIFCPGLIGMPGITRTRKKAPPPRGKHTPPQESRARGQDASVASHSKTITGEVDSWN